MKNALITIKLNHLLSFFILAALTSALFYTGNNIWLFTSSFLCIIATLAVVLKQRFHHSINISLNGIFVSAALLLIWFAISIIPSQIKYLTLYNFFWVGSLIIVFILFTLQDDQNKIWDKVWPAILILVSIWAIYGLVQYYYLHVPTNATFLNRNSLAALINLALIPAVAYFLLSGTERPWGFLSNKVLSLALIILFLTTFIITSRGASLSLLLGFIILFIFLKKQINKTQLYSLMAIIFIALLIAQISQYFIHHASFTERMLSLQNTEAAGNPRFIIWKSLIPLFQEMPWYGLGMGSLWVHWAPFRPAADTSAGFFAHNDYMQFTLEGGYPAIILLLVLFIVIFLNVNRALKTDLTQIQHFELVGLFAALISFAAHSFFTYNFYILPLLIIAGLYLGRLQQLVTLNSQSFKTLPPLKTYFKPAMYIISAVGIAAILSTYFISISLSDYYNRKARQLMLDHKFQDANELYLKSQRLAPLMDNPLFSHADLLRRGANQLLHTNKTQQADLLIKLALEKLDAAEKRHPLRPQIFHIRGLIYTNRQPDKAIREFEKALKLDPRFLFSRIQLATLLHQQNKLKDAIAILYEGVSYSYPTDKVMLEYMQLFAKYSREVGVESFALHLEANIQRFFNQNRQNQHPDVIVR